MSKDTRAQEIADTINTLRDWASHRDRTAFHACYREAVRSPELVLALRRRLGPHFSYNWEATFTAMRC